MCMCVSELIGSFLLSIPTCFVVVVVYFFSGLRDFN